MPEPLKDLAKSSEMFLPSGGEDDYIVEVEQACLPVEAGEDAIHEAREGGRSVAKSMGALLNSYSCPLLVRKAVFALSHSVMGTCQYPLLRSRVEKTSSPMESVEEVVYPGQRVSVFDGSCGKVSKIDAKTQATVLLPYHHHW